MVFKFLNAAYKNIWVPLFGRVLFRFVRLIEGNDSTIKPTYKIDDQSKSYSSVTRDDK